MQSPNISIPNKTWKNLERDNIIQFLLENYIQDILVQLEFSKVKLKEHASGSPVFGQLEKRHVGKKACG